MLNQEIFDDLKTAMKSGNTETTGVLRMVISALRNKSIEKRSQGSGEELSDQEVIALLQKEVKKRQEAADIYKKGNRLDLAEKEGKEVIVIKKYLPEQISPAEVEKVIDKIISGFHQQAQPLNFGLIMKSVTAELKGKTDARLISEIVKRKIS